MGRFSAYWMDLALSSRLVMHNYLVIATVHFYQNTKKPRGLPRGFTFTRIHIRVAL